MNRRDFCKSAVCAAVIAALPGEQWTRSWGADVWKSTHGRIITDEALAEAGFTHDGTDFNMQFTGYAEYKPYARWYFDKLVPSHGLQQ